MKKLAPILFVTLAGLVLPACGASPEAVCDDLVELAKKEAGEEAAKAIDRAECIKGAEQEKEMKGMMKWRTQANCAMDAESLEALSKCDSAE